MYNSTAGSIGTEIEKACRGIYPLQNCVIRKVKVLKKPKFDSTSRAPLPPPPLPSPMTCGLPTSLTTHNPPSLFLYSALLQSPSSWSSTVTPPPRLQVPRWPAPTRAPWKPWLAQVAACKVCRLRHNVVGLERVRLWCTGDLLGVQLGGSRGLWLLALLPLLLLLPG